MYASITPQQLAAWMKSEPRPHLLDVRQPEEHELAALPGSVLVPLGEIFHRAEEINPWRDQDVVVYCHHGIRSRNAIAQLKHLGFQKLHNLAGGIDRWSTEVDPQVPRYLKSRSQPRVQNQDVRGVASQAQVADLKAD